MKRKTYARLCDRIDGERSRATICKSLTSRMKPVLCTCFDFGGALRRHPARRTVACLAVEGVAIFRGHRSEARRQSLNEHGLAAFRLRQNGHAGQRAIRASQDFGPMVGDGHSREHLPVQLYVVHSSWFRLDLSHPPVKLAESLVAGGQHAVCSVGRMPKLKCLRDCSDRQTSELESKVCWLSTRLRKYDAARLEPWRRSATILSRVGRSPPEVLEAIGRQFGISNSPIGPLRR